MKIFPSLSILLTALALPTAILAGNGSVIRSPLSNTGVDADAAGAILSSLQASKSRFQVDLSKLDPGSAYTFKVGDLTEAAFTTDSKGRARLRFETVAGKGKFALDFDPRGKVVAVLNASQVAVLQAVLSGDGEPAAILVDESADLVAQNGVPGKASTRYTGKKDGSRNFEVTVSKTTETVLHLFVNGIDRGDIAIKGKAGKVQFSSAPKGTQTLLDFDPRGAQIDLFGADDAPKFSGALTAKASGVNFALRSSRGTAIPATAAAPSGAHAEAKLRISADARKHFSVEVEDVPIGNYELLVGDIVRGTIAVASRAAGGTKGELEFTNGDDHSRELLLDFEPVGAAITIRQGATIFFTGTFNPGTGAGVPVPAAGTPTAFTEALASTELDPNATAKAEFSLAANGEMEFEVEVEDVAAGKYQLFVGGTLRGTINAVAANNGSVRGKLKFKAAGVGEDRRLAARKGGNDDPAGDDNGGSDDKTPQVALRFDPRGQLLEIKSTAGIFFSHVFGEGSAPATGGTGTASIPATFTVALISSGADADGTARAEWKRDDRSRESFEVEIEDVPVGSYELLVGGTVRGTIAVTTTNRGTRGQIEFEMDDNGSALPLNFDPLGQVVTVRSGGTVYFQRTFPSGS